MALADILSKINKETLEKIAALEKEFNEKKKKLEEDNEKEQKKIDENMHQKVEEKSKQIIEKAESLAEREAKNRLLEAKRTVIDEALEEAIEKLAKSDKYEAMLADMLKKISLDDDNTVVIPAKGKEDATAKAIKSSGKKYFLSEKNGQFKGGFIVKTEKIEIDNSFETIINEQLREELEIKLHKTLFL